MGNRPPSGSVLGNNDHNYIVNIGKRVSIVFTGREVGKDRDGGSKESWTMVYHTGMSSCVLILSKMLGKHNTMTTPPSQHDHEKLVIEIHDTSRVIYNCYLNVQRDEAGLLHHTNEMYIVESTLDCFNSCTTNANGEITQTHIYIYGIGKRRGLLVTEWKKKGKDQNPYSGNMTHYFFTYENGLDVGLSLAIKRIRVLPNNGAIDFVVNGPEKHPADALAYMVNQVQRTQTWKPTDCPHCANNYILERQSDTESGADNTPPPLSQGRGGAVVVNPGRFKGRDMGNTYINRLYGRKWW